MSLQGGLIMRTIDYAPLYRSSIGFDRIFSMLDKAGNGESAQSYPPYNIERTGENAYRISMAVAGFGEDDLSIESKEHTLTVTGEKKAVEETEGSEFLFQGIASRAFERRFQLADHVEIKTARLENGLLHIDLVREIPEAMKPRKIAISKPDEKSKKVKQIAA
jgi:molecular chaperone IbpA